MTENEQPAAALDPAEPGMPDRVLDPVRRAMRRLGVLLLAVMIALPALQVVLREVIARPFVGAEELARFMLICVVFVTLPYVVSSGSSIRMEELLATLPRSVQRPVRAIGAALAFVAFGIAAASVAVATLRNLDNATPTLGIPYWIFFSAAFVGLLLAAIESGVQAMKALREQPLYGTFAEEQPPDDANLEHALGQPSSGRSAE